jgi:hypothetical protein
MLRIMSHFAIHTVMVLHLEKIQSLRARFSDDQSLAFRVLQESKAHLLLDLLISEHSFQIPDFLNHLLIINLLWNLIVIQILDSQEVRISFSWVLTREACQICLWGSREDAVDLFVMLEVSLDDISLFLNDLNNFECLNLGIASWIYQLDLIFRIDKIILLNVLAVLLICVTKLHKMSLRNDSTIVPNLLEDVLLISGPISYQIGITLLGDLNLK